MRTIALLAIAAAAFGQSTPPTKTFEVASIKHAEPPADGRLMIRMGGDAGRIDYKNVSLRDVVRIAFKVKDRQISGPDWINSQRYDIVAKFPSGATRDDIPVMLQALLADRFKLTYHKDSKEMPVYLLVPAKGGPKLSPATESTAMPMGRISMMMGAKGLHMVGKMTMPQFADTLSNFSDRIVVDKTKLDGTYDIDMEFKPEGGPGGGPGGGMMRMGPGGGPGVGPGTGPGPGSGASGDRDAQREDSDAPSLFTAIQEKFGLKLDPQKAPVDVYVIDHAEKDPTEN